MTEALPSRHYGENENLTLSDADLAKYGAPKTHKGGEKLRAYCPVHGGDNQRSLELTLSTGRFHCHNCGCWGYMDWAREEYARERGLDRDGGGFARSTRGNPSAPRRAVPKPPPPPPPVEPVRGNLDALMAGYREALPGSWGEKYLEYRGVPLDLAREHGVGYAAPSAWAGRGWKGGRLVFGHHRPDGRLVNLYGRAVGKKDTVPKPLKHDHLPGNKGWFNARAIREGDGPLVVCEAALDALALIASGLTRTVAIYGTYGWRWEWIPSSVREIVIAADADAGGEKTRDLIGTGARLRGIRVAYLDADSYGGEKDAAAAHAAGVLSVGEFPADARPPRRDVPGDGAAVSRRDYRAEARGALDAARRTLRTDAALEPVADAGVPKENSLAASVAAADAEGLETQRRAREALAKRRARERGGTS